LKIYFYRLKDTPHSKGIRSQKLHGYRITKKWVQFPEKIDITGMEDHVEEKVENDTPPTKKEYLRETLLDRGFTEEEIKSKKVNELEALLKLDEEISD